MYYYGVIMADGYYNYGLIDPRNGEMRYVGESKNLKQRLQRHCSPSKLKTNSHKNNWIKQVLATGLRPEIILLETYDTEQEALDAEVELIAYYRYIGCDLTNRTKGGDRGNLYVRTPEIKTKISNIAKGRKHIQETKDSISKTLTGYKRTEENCANISKGLKGKYIGEKASGYKRPHSEEEKQKVMNSSLFTRLTKEVMDQIKELWATGKYTQKQIGQMFDFSQCHISEIVNGKTKYAKDK